MMSPEEKATHAYEQDALADLLMGKWPYYEPEAYMAPSNVPTNWQKILEGLSVIADRFPDVSQKVNQTLEAMTESAEGVYCALEVVLNYLDIKTHLSSRLVVDCIGITDAARSRLPLLEGQARGLHLAWMGPTTETLWERLDVTCRVLRQVHGIHVLGTQAP